LYDAGSWRIAKWLTPARIISRDPRMADARRLVWLQRIASSWSPVTIAVGTGILSRSRVVHLGSPRHIGRRAAFKPS
jgi:hypothetical protein